MSEREGIVTQKEAETYRKRLLLMVFLDAVFVLISVFIGLWVRFDFSISHIPKYFISQGRICALVIALATLVIYHFMRLYKSMWRLVGISEGNKIFFAYILLIPVYLLTYFVVPNSRIPLSSLFIAYFSNLFFCIALRFGYRFLRHFLSIRSKNEDAENVLIIGAGQAAGEVIKDVRTGGHNEFNICAIIDDSEVKKGRDLDGVRIVGDRYYIPEAVEKYDIDRIIFCITNISHRDKSEILNICKDTGCKLQTVPGLFQLYSGEVVTKLRDVEISDLLERDEIKVNNEEIVNSLNGKVVLVTGAGGSIGSELSRQIASAGPKLLVLFDIYENSIYDLQQELKRQYSSLNLEVLIADMTDEARVRDIMQEYHPEVVFHAAAHKHVPLMEDSPNEAIKNNVNGTYILAEEAAKAGVKRFLLISTDKAVNPTNIMGASKRLCEMIIQMMNKKHPNTVYMAVRFGNVLGSNGSVVPLFKKQIAEGGPVTVTHKDIIRYFMTIPEAVSLVLQAEYYAKGGEIFVLDMGEPVKIDEMARNLIKLSGLRPDIDIKISYTGLRPGEKLYEELLMDEEGMTKTKNDLIYIGHPIDMDYDTFEGKLSELMEASKKNDDSIRELVKELVNTYKIGGKD